VCSSDLWRETLTWAGVIVAFTGALTANQLWEFQHRVEDRDRALAQRIMNRHDALVAKHELNPARAMTVVGPKRHGETPPTHLRSIGQSAFWVKWSIRGLFRSLYDKRVRFFRPDASPVTCPAFPNPGSMQVHAQSVVVCLVPADGSR